MRGAWIEISAAHLKADTLLSLPVRGAWIEIFFLAAHGKDVASLPVRGAWIEIGVVGAGVSAAEVAPRAGSVD